MAGAIIALSVRAAEDTTGTEEAITMHEAIMTGPATGAIVVMGAVEEKNIAVADTTTDATTDEATDMMVITATDTAAITTMVIVSWRLRIGLCIVQGRRGVEPRRLCAVRTHESLSEERASATTPGSWQRRRWSNDGVRIMRDGCWVV